MASPKNTRAIIVKQETYDRLLALRDEQRISNKKTSFDDVITGALDDKVHIAGKYCFPMGKAHDINSACVYYMSQQMCSACLHEETARYEFEKVMKQYDIKPHFKYVNLSEDENPRLALFHSTPYIILDTEFGTYGSKRFENIGLMWGLALDMYLGTGSGTRSITISTSLGQVNLDE